jgi:hypothetical protein
MERSMPDPGTYQANIFPLAGDPAARNGGLAVCFSGGGSRALSCALGQMSGLRSIKNPKDPTRSVLDSIPYVSSVSGGSWASVLYTFLPTTISDDEFLITPVAPDQLVKQQASVQTPQNVCYMAPHCMGTAPGQFNVKAIANVLYIAYEWDMFFYTERASWWWITAVGELILKPFGLYDATYDNNVNFIQPSKFFSLSKEYVRDQITLHNPTLTSDQFYLSRRSYDLFVNSNIMQNYTDPDTAQIPVQAKPTATSVLGNSPDGTVKGGGSVGSFAFTSALQGPGATAQFATVGLPRRYSLCDIAGCSSAFFAAVLLQYVDEYLATDLQNELAAILVSRLHFTPCHAQLVAGVIIALLEGLLNSELPALVPKYNFWPANATSQSPPPNTTYGFSDGGDFDNTGVLGALAQGFADRIIAFVNSSEPISASGPPNAPLIQVSGQIAQLFGYQYTPVNGKFVSYGGMSPQQPLSYVQVFSDAAGEFQALLQGLYDASCGGPNNPNGLGTDVAAFQQTLTTVDNPVANIKGGRKITVLWVHNNRVNAWQGAIKDAGINKDLVDGQAAAPSGPLANFPHYNTFTQLWLGPESVNMLAQLSAWNVQQLAPVIAKML